MEKLDGGDVLQRQFETEFEFSDLWSFEWRRIKRAIGIGLGEEKRKTKEFFYFLFFIFYCRWLTSALVFTFRQGSL